MAASPLLESAWLEPALLVGASRRASKLSDAARARMRPWVVAARARYRVARELRDLETQGVALGLLAQTAFFALCALEAADPSVESPSRTPQEAWARFEALAEKPAGAPDELPLVSATFSAADPLAVDVIEPVRANDLRLAAEATAAWLLGLAEVRTPAELTRARFVRTALAALGIALVACSVVLYALSLAALDAPPGIHP